MSLLLYNSGVATLPAKLQAVFALIARGFHWVAASLTVCRFGPHIGLIPEAVMFVAHSSSKVGSTTFFALARRTMNPCVLSNAAAKLKIGNAVVIPYLVFMVDLLLWLKKASNMFLHYETMLLHIATTIASWVVWLKHSYVTIIIFIGLSNFQV